MNRSTVARPSTALRRAARAIGGSLLGTALVAAIGLGGAAPAAAASGLPGIDVYGGQGNVNWSSVKSAGYPWAYVKATEGGTYTNPSFGSQYNGAYNAGLVRGAYHFAHPDSSGGAAQADYFVAHGGGWSADGRTLPGTLDIEYKPGKGQPACWNVSQAAMVNWIGSFVTEYHAKTSRYPVIYTTADWWKSCTGDSTKFSANSALWIANPNVGSNPPLMGGWSRYTFWQYGQGSVPGVSNTVDKDVFNGSAGQLTAFAKGA